MDDSMKLSRRTVLKQAISSPASRRGSSLHDRHTRRRLPRLP